MSAGPTSSACRRRSSPTTPSSSCSATSSPAAATRSRCHGEAQWNGVAILSRAGLDDVVVGIPGAPGFPHPEARAVSASCGGIRVHCVYVPNGRTPDSEHYHYKLAWLARAARDGRAPIRSDAMVCGDMNIAPTDIDVFDPDAYVGPDPRHAAGAGSAGRARRRSACATSCAIAGRPSGCSPTGTTGPGCSTRTSGCGSTWCWPATPVAGRVRAAWVDRQARKGTGPSDHAPVIVDLDEAPDGDIGPVVPPPSAPARPVSR